MPTLVDDGSLLRLGVGNGTIADIQPFDLGGAGIVTNEQPFDIEAPYVGVTNVQIFDLGLLIGTLNEQPFDLGEVASIINIQPFDIIANIPNPAIGNPQPNPPLAVTTTLTATALVGATTVSVASVAGIATGTTVYIGNNAYLVTNVAALVLTLAIGLVDVALSGTTVGVPAVNTTLSAPASIGATSVTVTDATAIVVGSVISITSSSGVTEYRTVTGVSGSVVSFSTPLGSSYGVGSGVAPPGPFLTAMMVFDKAGNSLGAITDYVINSPRSYAIREPGGMGFYIPRNSPDVALIASDRLVAVTNEVGLPVWAGTIATQDWTSSTVNVHCEDIFALLVGVPVELEMEILDNTPASGIYQAVIDLVNARRGLDGEIQWGVDFQSTNPFLGDLELSGDPLDALNEISNRSGTEFAWSATVSGNLSIALVVRDSFMAGAGVSLADGPGGNVASSPTYSVDPTTIINGIRITGNSTEIIRYVEDWADWAVHEFEPVVEIYADTGDFRRRIDLDMSVDFSISKNQQRALAQRTQDEVWDLYERYLYAMHDIMGRPNHEGWWYEGPTEEIEPELTKDNWHTHQELALFRDGRPAALVMKSDSTNAWVLVTYLMSTSRKVVNIYGFDSVYNQRLVDAVLAAGTYTIYEESGGRAQIYTQYTTGGESGWILDTTSITATLANGTRISLRGIRTPAAFRGRYVDLREPGYTITIRPPVSNVFSEGEVIGKIWPFERGRIRDWDPRRDGTGALLTKTTVYSGQLTTRPRWHNVPYSVGEAAETQLAEGIFVVDAAGVLADVIFVDSNAGFPIDAPPFQILVGDPLVAQEIMTVTATFGNRWSVQRGQTITAVTTTSSVSAGATVIPVTDSSNFVVGMKIIIGGETITLDAVAVGSLTTSTALTQSHPSGTTVTTNGLIFSHERGTLVRMLGGEAFEGFVYPYTWPEGEEYANNLLERLRLPSRLVSLNVTNENDDWATFQLGTTHAVNIQSEGPPGGVTATIRVIGLSPDEDNGVMEVIVEVLP